ncbi:MAG TPA: tRNA lysidine(34) synthetase TilS [Acidimicrobiales bacterium]|nr:tRNA lysidine(34) synthetase TilS [Acidimicrobiales bacterium]
MTAARPAVTDELLARCAFPPPGTAATVAASGGADSLALLLLAVAAGLDVTAVHVDHGLRPGSDLEAGVVAAAAGSLGVPWSSVRVEVGAGPNLEARARKARRAVLPADAMTGHTLDDRAETVVLNLLRGSGLDGLGGIRPGPTKPILALRRAETTALCEAAGLVVVDDPSNRDPAFRRNRVRHELLPLANDVAERDLAPVLARTADLLADDAAALDALALALDPTDARALAAAPVAVARRAVRGWLVSAAPPHPPDAATVARVLAVAGGEARATEVGAGRRVARTAGRLRLEPPDGGAGRAP